MNRFVWSRMALVASVSACAALMPGLAQAEGSGDSLSLKIASALQPDRFFMRATVIGVHIKTKSADTVDVTGPVVSKYELRNVFAPGRPVSDYPNINWVGTQGTSPQDVYDAIGSDSFLRDTQVAGLETVINRLGSLPGIGTPRGLKGEAASTAGTAGISLGYFLDDEHKWVIETFLLAAPVHSSVRAKGLVQGSGNTVSPMFINDQKILTTKLVPPTVMFGRYWGDKNSKFRPYTGVVAMYAIFTDTKATDFLNTYVGGGNPGDTTVSIKNSFGMGPMVGMRYQFADSWHASLNIGSVKLKANAKITTRNTFIGSGAPVLGDLGAIGQDIRAGESIFSNAGGCKDGYSDVCEIVRQNGGLASILMKGVIADRAAGRTENGLVTGDGQSLGTYVRKTDTTLTSTLFMLSVGRSF